MDKNARRVADDAMEDKDFSGEVAGGLYVLAASPLSTCVLVLWLAGRSAAEFSRCP
jgi:hypothetical protein